MNTKASSANDLVELIENVVNRIMSKKSIATIHKEGIVKSLADSNGKYTVTINDDDYQIYGDASLNLSINNVVIIEYYNGDPKKKWILCKKPKW